MKQTIRIEELPVKVVLPRKTVKDKVIYLNLNVYRNLDYHSLNQSKIEFDKIVGNYLRGVKINPPFIVRYYLTIGSKRELDVANVCSVFDKFFSDSLVNHGCIPDDNYKFLKGVSYEYAGYEKGNSYITVEIIEI